MRLVVVAFASKTVAEQEKGFAYTAALVDNMAIALDKPRPFPVINAVVSKTLTPSLTTPPAIRDGLDKDAGYAKHYYDRPPEQADPAVCGLLRRIYSGVVGNNNT